MSATELSDAEYLKIVDEAWEEAWEIVNSQDGWKEEKKNEHGDVVVSKKNKRGKKIYRVTAVINVSPEKLVNAVKDTTKLTEWNNTLINHKVLKQINENVAISYQVTAEGGPGGVVSSRDFILLFKSDYKGKDFFQGGVSVEFPDAPKVSKIVRAWNGPGGQIIRPIAGKPDCCEFIWLMDCEYRGWIPSSILEIAMPVAQFQLIDCVRKLAVKLQ